jgi:phospholipid/cholesterol/gamma-HCH transport system substrate-binding protein
VRRRNEILVGLVIVSSIVVMIFGTLWLQGARFASSTIVVDAVFREVGQLRPGNEAKLRGVSIGRVDEIRVGPDATTVIVSFRIDGNLDLPPETVVILSPESLFGDWQAEFASRAWHPGLEFQETEDPDVLPGYAIPDISRLTLQAERIANNLGTITDRVETAFTEETAENLRQAIANIQEVSQTLSDLVNQQGVAIEEVTTEVQRAAQEVGDAAAAGRNTFETLDRVVSDSDLPGMMEDARAATASLRVISGDLAEVSGGFDGAFTRADSTLLRLDRLTARIEAGEGSLGRLLSDSTLVVEAESVLRELEALLKDFQENPKKYVRLSIF